jgi:hypothetical protein
MWRQFYNMCRTGAHGLYISMFDEYNEGTQISKTAENASQIPAGSASGPWTRTARPAPRTTTRA